MAPIRIGGLSMIDEDLKSPTFRNSEMSGILQGKTKLGKNFKKLKS
jgi:hypothetical protein